jgi:hypothetical protein
VGDLVDAGTGGLADGRQGVDRRDTLGEHGVGGELGELGRPEADGEDTVGGDPIRVDVLERLASVLAGLGLEGADEDTVRGEQVGNGGTLREELCRWLEGTAGDTRQHVPGLERMSKVQPGLELASRMVRMDLSRVSTTAGGRYQVGWETLRLTRRYGTVDFSTTILEEVETSAIRRVASWR